MFYFPFKAKHSEIRYIALLSHVISVGEQASLMHEKKKWKKDERIIRLIIPCKKWSTETAGEDSSHKMHPQSNIYVIIPRIISTIIILMFLSMTGHYFGINDLLVLSLW